MQHYLTILKALYKIKYWYSLLLIKAKLWMLKHTSSNLWMDLVTNTWVVNWSKIVINENKNISFISFQFILINNTYICSYYYCHLSIFSYFIVYYFILTLLSKGILLYFQFLYCSCCYAIISAFKQSNCNTTE